MRVSRTTRQQGGRRCAGARGRRGGGWRGPATWRRLLPRLQGVAQRGNGMRRGSGSVHSTYIEGGALDPWLAPCESAFHGYLLSPGLPFRENFMWCVVWHSPSRVWRVIPRECATIQFSCAERAPRAAGPGRAGRRPRGGPPGRRRPRAAADAGRGGAGGQAGARADARRASHLRFVGAVQIRHMTKQDRN